MKFELYKIFKKKIVLIFIGVGLLWLSLSILLPVLQYRTFTEQMEPLTGIEAIHYDRDLQNLYAGQYTADEFAPLYAEYKKIYNNPDYQCSDNGDGYSFSLSDQNTTPLTDEAYYKYLNRYGVIAKIGNRANALPLYIEDAKISGSVAELYEGSIVQSSAEDNLVPPVDLENPIVQKVLGMYDNLNTSFYGEYLDGWESFFNTVPIFFQYIVGLIILIGVSPIFAEERHSGSDKVLLTTQYGKSKLIRDKIVACFLFATFVFVLFFACSVFVCIAAYGTSGLKASIQLVAHCTLSPYNLSIGVALILWGLLGWGAALVTAAGALLISAASPNAFVAFIPSLVGYIVPVVSFAELSPTIHRFMQLLPINIIGAIDRLFSMSDFYNIFGLLIEKKIVCVIVWVILIVLCVVFSSYLFRSKKASN